MLNVMQGLNDYNIVYYQSYDYGIYSPGLHELISDLLDEKKAYTVLSNMSSQNDSPYNIVIVLGAFNEIFELDDYIHLYLPLRTEKIQPIRYF